MSSLLAACKKKKNRPPNRFRPAPHESVPPVALRFPMSGITFSNILTLWGNRERDPPLDSRSFGAQHCLPALARNDFLIQNNHDGRHGFSSGMLCCSMPHPFKTQPRTIKHPYGILVSSNQTQSDIRIEFLQFKALRHANTQSAICFY